VPAIDRALINNRIGASSHFAGSLPAPPAQHLAVLTCMDARLHVATMLGLEAGDAHVIRNAGGVVTEDVIRSLVISQRLLGTREVMVIHHTDCGMLGLRDDEVKAQIERQVGVRPSFALEGFSDLEGGVREAIARIRASPFILHRDGVRGFIYELRTGRLAEVTGG